MRKEIIIALIIGISFGLVIAFGVRIARHSLANRGNINPSPKLLTSDSSASSFHSILITSPEPDQIISDSPIKIVGTTSPLSMVGARTGSTSATGISDESGAFTVELALKPGPNIIVVDSYNPEGDNAQIEFTTVLSSADLTATPSAKKK